MHPARAAALCGRVVSVLSPLLLEEDHAAVFPSRFPLPVVHSNASRSLLRLCSSPKCPPALLPGVIGRRIEGFAQLGPAAISAAPAAPAAPDSAAVPVLGAPVSVAGQPREEVRLGLARLVWLEQRGLLRGEAQVAVLRHCRKIQAWASWMEADSGGSGAGATTGALSELQWSQ
jgi:hypothetical protein